MGKAETAREKWSRIIREQQSSGLTIAAFCAGRGVAVSSFYPWKRRLASAGDGAAAFVEARVVGGAGERRGPGLVAIELACGRRIVVARGFDPELLLEVIEALESDARGAAGGGQA
jgi:hypothetical protein